MDRATFWATQSPEPIFESIAFEHPALAGGAVRLVANQFEAVTLGGHAHIPAAMSIKPPESAADASPKLTLAFPGAAVDPDTGLTVRRLFKRALREIQASGSRDPITVRYAVYLGDTDAPEVTWLLYVSDKGGVTFNADTVQVTATLDNPMTRAVAPIYTPDVFTGLELIG
jgi:hypothetical protein